MNNPNDPTGGNEVLDEEDEALFPPLLDNPTVTIYFDGLIHTAFDETKSLYQAAVLTQAEGHHLNIEVRIRGEEELLFPTEEVPWNPSHGAVKELAPFWLYVDSGNKISEKEFSSSLHLPRGEDPQSFARLFNFDQQHGKPLVPKPETFAEFNFPQGTCYSAENRNAKLKVLPPNKPVSAATEKRPFTVSTRGAVDIDAVSNGDSKKYIVLATQAGQEFFRFELEPGKHYQIELLNQPIPHHNEETPHEHHHPEPDGGHGGHGEDHLNPEEHFLQYYELFGFTNKNERFIVDFGPLPPSPDSPPCVSTSGDLKGGLGGS